MKIKSFGLSETQIFHFIGYLETGGGGGGGGGPYSNDSPIGIVIGPPEKRHSNRKLYYTGWDWPSPQETPSFGVCV